jgi:class 3 adenylate cyclase
VIGDTVNIASRLEGMTRELECSFLLTESAMEPGLIASAGARIALKTNLMVKGKADPVSVLGVEFAGV